SSDLPSPDLEGGEALEEQHGQSIDRPSATLASAPHQWCDGGLIDEIEDEVARHNPLDREGHRLAIVPNRGRVHDQLDLTNQQGQRPHRCWAATADTKVTTQGAGLVEVAARYPDLAGGFAQRVDRCPAGTTRTQDQHRPSFRLETGLVQRQGER